MGFNVWFFRLPDGSLKALLQHFLMVGNQLDDGSTKSLLIKTCLENHRFHPVRKKRVGFRKVSAKRVTKQNQNKNYSGESFFSRKLRIC